MNKFKADQSILSMQRELEEAGNARRQAERDGCSDDLIIALMDAEDAITAKLLAEGCHIRDCR